METPQVIFCADIGQSASKFYLRLLNSTAQELRFTLPTSWELMEFGDMLDPSVTALLHPVSGRYGELRLPGHTDNETTFIGSKPYQLILWGGLYEGLRKLGIPSGAAVDVVIAGAGLPSEYMGTQAKLERLLYTVGPMELRTPAGKSYSVTVKRALVMSQAFFAARSAIVGCLEFGQPDAGLFRQHSGKTGLVICCGSNTYEIIEFSGAVKNKAARSLMGVGSWSRIQDIQGIVNARRAELPYSSALTDMEAMQAYQQLFWRWGGHTLNLAGAFDALNTSQAGTLLRELKSMKGFDVSRCQFIHFTGGDSANIRPHFRRLADDARLLQPGCEITECKNHVYGVIDGMAGKASQLLKEGVA